ncbi:MAG: hypothetical protein KAW88_01725 [Candidatus Cloacimonetes bacterium]|nr:hypothetical protein [Candidatus Cloacimonadota bacterium]
MKYLEVIELRTSQENHSLLEQYLTGWIKQVKKDIKVQSIKIYKHVDLETDFSIHLHHDLKIKNLGFKETTPFSLGELLKNELKEFELVNHSVWIEQYQNRNKKYHNLKKEE